MNILAWVYAIELALGMTAGWAFVIQYWRTYRWWKHQFGIHLVSFSAIVAAFYTLYFFRTLAQPGMSAGSTGGGFGVFRFILFTLLTAVVVWRLIVFLPERLRREQDQDDGASGPRRRAD